MDPLNVAASITGLSSATGQVARLLAPYIAAAQDTPKIAHLVHDEVQNTGIILASLQRLTSCLASGSARHATLLLVDHIVAVLTDGVLLFSELETELGSLPPRDPSGQRPALRYRLQWASKENAFAALLTRLQAFKASMTLMLMILKSDSDIHAAEHQKELNANVSRLLESNMALSRRLMNLEDAFDTRAMGSRPGSPAGTTLCDVPQFVPLCDETESSSSPQDPESPACDKPQLSSVPETAIPIFNYEEDLEASHVYRRAQRDTMDFSFRSSIARTNAWSTFSGLSLADVSVMAVIALPVYQEDLKNANHYDFGDGSQPIAVAAAAAQLRPACHKRPILHECLEIELQLRQISGFPELFDDEASRCDDAFAALWAVLRKGYPLLMLLNTLDSRWGHSEFLERSLARRDALGKHYVALFLRACANDLDFPVGDLFTVLELIGDDCWGFFKVIAVVSCILDKLVELNIVEAVDVTNSLPTKAGCSPQESRAETLVENFLTEQRAFVANLENLASIKSQIEAQGQLSRDQVHIIFGGPLTLAVVNFHIRLLIRMEKNAQLPLRDQRWEPVFLQYSDDSNLESSFIFNERRARDTICSCLEKRIRDQLSHLLLTCLALIPVVSWRLSKYPAFLQDLQKQAIFSSGQHDDLQKAWSCLHNTLDKVSKDIRREQVGKKLSKFLDFL